MSKIIHINSTAHFQSTVSSSTYVVCDFYADWCGPCKTIAPIFEQLASAESSPGKIAFAKVNVDSQQDVARTYSVTAMPTFLILRNGSVTETIRGANPSALRSAVLAASAQAAKGPAKQSAAFSSKGHTLGNEPRATRPTPQRSSASPSLTIPTMDTVTRFVNLYARTLFSLDATAAAEASPDIIRR